MEALAIMKTHSNFGFDVGKARMMSGLIQRQCEKGHAVIFSLWRSMQKAVADSPLHTNRQTASLKVANFCVLAGCPAPVQDPLINIHNLRQYLASNPSEIREAALRREIEDLRKTTQSQQRIITNLTFRHLLENLPPAANGTTSTARWSSFFRSALNNVPKQGHHMHPLKDILLKYSNSKQIETVGVGLYGTFSTNIHHFTSQYAIIDSQWNALEMDIMKALVPLPSNATLTEVDWSEERKRY